MKLEFEPRNALGPVPVVLVSTGTVEGPHNIITIAWVGTVNSVPPMIALGVRPSRYSHRLIKDTRELVVNLAREDQVDLINYCGMVSGEKVDKFQEMGLTPAKGKVVEAPLIAECPVNMECVVRRELGLPTHDVFIAEVVKVWADEEVCLSGEIFPSLVLPLSSMGDHYWALGRDLGAKGNLL